MNLHADFLYKSITYGFSKVKTVASEHLSAVVQSYLLLKICNSLIYIENLALKFIVGYTHLLKSRKNARIY